VWHELVLHGIGGNTIAEAKARLSYREFCDWLRYRNQRGTLNDGLRVEMMVGQFMALWANSKSKKAKFKAYDFTPNIPEPPVSLERAMEEWL